MGKLDFETLNPFFFSQRRFCNSASVISQYSQYSTQGLPPACVNSIFVEVLYPR